MGVWRGVCAGGSEFVTQLVNLGWSELCTQVVWNVTTCDVFTVGCVMSSCPPSLTMTLAYEP